MEIIPSARTGKVCVKSGSFQTDTNRASSGPITYEGLACERGVGELSVAGVEAFVWAEFCVHAGKLPNVNTIPTSMAMVRFMSSPKLRRSILAVTNLLEFVQQSLVADLQFLRSAPPVPACPGEHFQDQFLFSFARCRPRSVLQRYLFAVRPVGGAHQHGAQSSHRDRFVPDGNDGPRCSLQFAKISRPRVILEQLLRLNSQRRNRTVKNLGIPPQKECHQVRDILFPLAKRRNPKTDATKPVIEILTKTATTSVGFEIAGTATNQPHIRRS